MFHRLAPLAVAGLVLAGCGGSATSAQTPSQSTNVSALPSVTASAAALTPATTATPSAAAVSEVDCLGATSQATKLDKTWSEYSDTGNGAFVEITLDLTNNCDRDIKAYAGTVEVFDTFGDSIFQGNWKQTKKIAVGKSARSKEGQGYGFSEYEDPITALRDAELADLTVEFTPSKIVFADGTMIEE